jgi:hypothetical protein
MGNACIRAYGDSLIKVILAGKVTRVSQSPANIIFKYQNCTISFITSVTKFLLSFVGVWTKKLDCSIKKQ